MPIEVERTKLLKRSPWNKFTSTNLTEFVRLGLIPESRKEHRRGVIAWESEDTIIRLGVISDYYDNKTKHPYGFALYALLLGIKGFPPVRWTGELSDKLKTLFGRGTESMKNMGQETYPGLYAAYDLSVDSEDLDKDDEIDKAVTGFAAMVPWKSLKVLFPIFMGWDSFGMDGLKEFVQQDASGILGDTQQICRKVTGESLGEWLENPEGRLTQQQRDLFTEAINQLLEYPPSLDSFMESVTLYSEADWGRLFRLLPTVNAALNPFIPDRIQRSDLLPWVMVCVVMSDFMKQLITKGLLEQASSPESSSFPEWGNRISRIREHYRTKYLRYWTDDADVPKKVTTKENQPSETIEEVQ